MDGKQLRNSILQWAIQGKLVPQDPNDEPASVLLERIREEKARLVKEKKIKRDKNESIIYRGDDNSYYEKFTATGEVKCIDDEIPFALPTGWEWTRFGSLINIRMGKTPPRGDINHWNNGTTPWVSISDMSDYGIVKSTKEKVSEYAVRNAFGNVVVPAGTLLMSFKLTVGRTSILDIDALHNEAIISIKPYVDNDNTLRDYLFYVLPLIANSGESKDAIKGKTLNSTSLYNLLIPLPPLDEQHRIVCKIRQVLPFVEIYALSQVKQNALNDSIIPQLRKSILQEAIQGKLVEQNLDDEPASVLLERIKQEKERLIKEKKIKRDKQDSFIYRGDDNKYYENVEGQMLEVECNMQFPQSWQLCRLSFICQLTDGIKMKGNHICLDAKYLRGKSTGVQLGEGKFVQQGDNIILVDGENSGEVFTVPIEGYMGSTFKQLWVSKTMNLQYVLYVIRFYKDMLRNTKKGAAIPHLNKQLFYNIIVGIPPIKEQSRIVAMVNQLFHLSD